MRFTATIEQSGKTTTGIPVPDEVVDSLGAGRRPPVRVTLNGYTYRSTIASMGGRSMISVSAEVREKANVAGGAEVDVELELDTAPRQLPVPDDFAAALDAEPDARRFFDGLSFSNRRWHVDSIVGARTDDTRQRRIEKSVAMLREGRAR